MNLNHLNLLRLIGLESIPEQARKDSKTEIEYRQDRYLWLKLDSIRQAGYRVNIEHGRIWDDGMSYTKNAISRGERDTHFKETKQPMSLGIGYMGWEDKLYESMEPCQFGGYTKLKITCPDGTVYTGKYNVKNNEQFHHKFGLVKAFENLLQK